MKRYIKINSSDNVAVALADGGLAKGEKVSVAGGTIELQTDIARGHKFALRRIKREEEVVKYGYPIGVATADIEAGDHIHLHNLRTGLNENLSYTYHPAPPTRCDKGETGESLTVNGYLRKNGDMGIRNELWVIPTVGCVNGQAEEIVRRLKMEEELGGVDDIQAYTHNYGCSQLGEDHINTRRAIAALALHPNVGGVLLLGLGCENNQLAELKTALGDHDKERVRFLVAQEVEDEIEEGVKLCRELIEKMHGDRREPLPLSKLKVGLKCGGSDGLSGITANPLVGLFSDWLIQHGGTTLLTEVPEMFGAETILMERSVDERVFNETVSLINDFKEYFRGCGQPIYENPSPGNKDGGITTLEEKSLGCVQKGGSMPVVDVLRYGEAVKKSGLNLLQAPGNDLVAATALALSGCQMVLFTTGRGTPFGTVVPTMKISTNSALAGRKGNWVDFNAGAIVEDKEIEEVLAGLIDKVLKTADGARVKHELNNSKGIAIFKTGVTL